MEIKIIKCLDDNYSYIIFNKETLISAVIDPSEADPIIHEINKNKFNLKYILNTHHHYDHVGGNEKLKEKYNCKIVGFEKDKNRIPGIDIGLNDNQTWKNELLYSWVKRYPNQWTLINLDVDNLNKEIRLSVNGEESEMRHGTGTESPLVYTDHLKRYGSQSMYMGKPNKTNPQQKYFRGQVASVKIHNSRGDLILDYDFNNASKQVIYDNSGHDNHGYINGCKIKNEVIKEILKIGDSLCGNILIIDALKLTFRKVKLNKRSDCYCNEKNK